VVNSLLEEFPFERNERGWVSSKIHEDFPLPGRRDLLYLVLCTLTKNALMALRGREQPSLLIEVGRGARPWMRFADNGPGIAPGVLARLTHEPVTTRGEAGGSGMGLMFCRRVMQSIGGEIEVASPPAQGTAVTLYFKPLTAAEAV
jgi:two-component system, response regulator PhcR